ncbi:MAG: hypothetical protein JST82_10285 [Bacteroidetes bacterium]|nr:hypothetical protein [Bacteroidota bacterium]
MMKRLVPFAVVVLCCYVLQGCNIINPAEKVPTYFRVDSITVKKTDPSRTGSVSSKINSIWVYQNNDIIGVYELPATVPVPLDNATTIRLAPAISVNGLKNYQNIYPYYTFDTFVLNPAPGKIINHNAVVQYTDVCKFQWREDFETGNGFVKYDATNANDTTVVRVTDPSMVFEGSAAGYIYLDGYHTSSQNITSFSNPFPISTGESYVELNYKCNVDFSIGLLTTKSGDVIYNPSISFVKAKESWNKIYISLSSFVGQYQSTGYRLMITAKLPDGQSTGYVLLDNIKVISN